MISALDQTALLTAQYGASRAQSRAEVARGQLASGLQGDGVGAANEGIAAQLDSEAQSAQQANSNALDDASVYLAADTSLQTLTGLASQMRALAVQSGNATLTGSNRAAVDAAYQQLGQEVDRVAASTSYNGTPLFSGAGLDDFQVGTSSDASSRLAANIAAVGGASLGVAGTDVKSTAAAGQALDRLDGAIAQLSTARSQIGAGATALAAAASQTQSQAFDATAAFGRIAGTDYASATAAYQQALVGQQAAYAAAGATQRSMVRPLAALVAG